MSEVKWIKIVTDIFDDEKILLIETLPEGDSIIVLWFKLLCLAGKQNNSGVFIMQNGMPYTDKMLSIIFRRKEATVKLALDTFQAFGMIEIVENAITIPNWGKHQNFDKIEAKNAYMRQYMKSYRVKQTQIASGKPQAECKANVNDLRKANVSLAEEIREDKKRKEKSLTAYADDFENFWQAYPKKVGKADAAKKFQKALKIASAETIIEAVGRYCKSKTVVDGFICNPATWLHQERWNDLETISNTAQNLDAFFADGPDDETLGRWEAQIQKGEPIR